MQCVTLPRITELNPHLLCVLCGGYYIDATSIIECLHSFCKSCIVRYLETHKYCPICDVLVHKTEPLQNIRPDVIRQSIVYKLVPNLYKKEMRNRRNFYTQVNPQEHPACAESKGEITESSNFFSMDDLISLSLEYVNSINEKNYFFVAKGTKRYFRCRAAVNIRSFRKLIAAKYALGVEHKIQLFLNGIQLPDHFKLLDIAYISSWKRVGYIRILYEILSAECNSTGAVKIDLSSKTEPLGKKGTDEPVKNANANSTSDDAITEKPENMAAVSIAKTIDDVASKISPGIPSITVDVTSAQSTATNTNTSSQPSKDITIVNSDPAPSAKPIPVTDDERIIVSTAQAVASATPIDKAVTESAAKTELRQNIELKAETKEEEVLLKEAAVNEPVPAQKNVTEANSVAVTDNATESNSPPTAPATAHKKDDKKKGAASIEPTPAKQQSAAEQSANKKERRSDRSDTLPPVPALRMINPIANTSTAKTLTCATSATVRPQPIVSLPRITNSPRQTVAKRTTNLPAPATNNPLRLVPAPVHAATDLISLYAKSPTRNSAAPSLPPKRPTGAAAPSSATSSNNSLSILRIDPKTLSPIDTSMTTTTTTSSSSTLSATKALTIGASCGGSAARRMLPCRPITSSAYANSSVYACSGAPPLLPFAKFSASAGPLYPPFPHIERSSLHPMNELVRRMFPFNFGPIDPTKTPLDPSGGGGGLTPYPQSISSAVNHFLTAKPPPPSLPRQPKGEKHRRKQAAPPPCAAVGAAAQVALSLNGGRIGCDAPAAAGIKASNFADRGNRGRGYKRNNTAVTNGQIKSAAAAKRKNLELSDFSINNLIPVDDVKRAPPPLPPPPALMHACAADGIHQVCDQVRPDSAPESRGKAS